MTDEIRQDADGNWTVDFSWAHIKPISGIPTKALAEQIESAMWDAYRAGSDSYAASEM